MNVFYQLIGLGALAAMALSFYQKGKRQIMLWQMAAFACFILHYGLIGALSGSLCNVVQIISMLLFAARDRFHWPVLQPPPSPSFCATASWAGTPTSPP